MQDMATPATTTVLSLKVVKRHLDKALKTFDEREQRINSQKFSLQAKINREMNSLIHIIEERKKQLVSQLDSLAQQKLQILSAHKQKVELSRTKMSNVLLEATTQVGHEEQEITVEFEPSTIQPQIEADMIFIRDKSEQIRQNCKDFGSVYSEQVAIDNCIASGEGLGFAINGRETIVTVDNLIDKLDLAAELVDNKRGASIKCDIKRENGRRTITYQPVSRGKHSLHIRINHRPIKGSPYPVAVTPSPESLRKPIRIIEGLSKPRGIATNSKGELIVAEYKSNYVSIIAQDGKKKAFGGFGTEHGKFNKPRGVAIDKDDNIYVSDSGNHRVQKFTSEGKFIATVGCMGSEDGQFNLPLGICFSKKKDRLYVCDQVNYRVQVFSAHLTFKRSFGSEGHSDGLFNFPENIAIDDSNTVLYISDYYNNRVQVFTADGQFIRSITHKSSAAISSTSSDKLKHPRAIAMDGGGVLYVSEWGSDGVCLFSSQGEFVELLGNKGGEQVDRVCGLAVDMNNCVIVSRYSKIEMF